MYIDLALNNDLLIENTLNINTMFEMDNLQNPMNPFTEYEGIKYRNDLLEWIQSLSFLDQINNNNNSQNNKNKDDKNSKFMKQKKQKKVIEILTTLQQYGICSIADLLHVHNEKVCEII